jgi:tetratricopeptide (TPR) repeat protein
MLCNEYAAAEQLDDESLRLCRSSDDAWGTAWSLYALAFLKLAVGNLVQAQPALEEALAQLRQQDMPFGAFRTLLALGYTRYQLGDVAGAEALYREGLALCREMPLQTIITTGLEGQAMVVAARGQPLRAARLWGAAEALREMTDEWRWQSYQHAYDRALTEARAQVSSADWTIAWAAGRALTVAQAIAEALDDPQAPQVPMHHPHSLGQPDLN